jgi:hypothetical protein
MIRCDVILREARVRFSPVRTAKPSLNSKYSAPLGSQIHIQNFRNHLLHGPPCTSTVHLETAMQLRRNLDIELRRVWLSISSRLGGALRSRRISLRCIPRCLITHGLAYQMRRLRTKSILLANLASISTLSPLYP